jgi:DNA invertase Pin-like site-specific DNA recombinase
LYDLIDAITLPHIPAQTARGALKVCGHLIAATGFDRQASLGADAVRERGASLEATEQPIDTSTTAGKCFLGMLGVFTEFETNLQRERRPASIDVTQVRAMKAGGVGATEIAKALKIGRATVYWAHKVP